MNDQPPICPECGQTFTLLLVADDDGIVAGTWICKNPECETNKEPKP